MRCFEGHRDLYCDANRLVELQWTTPETMTQRLAFDVFGGDVVAVVGFANLEDGQDVRMIEGQDCARLLLDA